jgi:hypothetical protein
VTNLPCDGQSDAKLAATFVASVRQHNTVLAIPRTWEALRPSGFDRIVASSFAERHEGQSCGLLKFGTRQRTHLGRRTVAGCQE